MGGTIHAHSELNVGSAFTVTVPLALTDASIPHASLSVSPALIVTRRPALADAVQRLCRLLGVACRPIQPDGPGTSVATLIAAGREAVILDVDSCLAEATHAVTVGTDRQAGSRCIFLGRPATLEGLGLDPETARILPKPLSLATLGEVLNAVNGDTANHFSMKPGGRRFVRLRGHVLIVEDNAVNAAVFEGLLEEIGCSHTTVTTGREAVSLASSQAYAAILMDIHMPDMNGWMATEAIRRAEGTMRHTPIIALTADPSDVHHRRCLKAGMDSFLTKPLVLRALHAALVEWLPVEVPEQTLNAEALTRIRCLERDGRGGFLKRLATVFVDTSSRQVETILAAVSARDMSIIGAQCHTLKSAAAHVGAEHLAQLAIDLERAANSGDVAQVVTLADGLGAARTAAVEALHAELARNAA